MLTDVSAPKHKVMFSSVHHPEAVSQRPLEKTICFHEVFFFLTKHLIQQ